MWRKRSNLKHGNVKTLYNGQWFHSKGEANYYAGLLLEQRAGVYKTIETQVRFPCLVNDTRICVIVVDFRVTYPNGRIKVIEYKGHETDLWKLKWKLFRALYPKIDVEVVKHGT